MNRANPLFLIATFTLAIPALAKDATAQVATPAWCGDTDRTGEEWSELAKTEAELKNEFLPNFFERSITNVSDTLCAARSPMPAAERSKLKALQAAWSQRLGLKETDWADTVNLRDEQPTTHDTHVARGFTPEAVDRWTPMQQLIRWSSLNDDELADIDRLGPGVSMLGRYAASYACLKLAYGKAGAAHFSGARWALCGIDVAQLDTRQAMAEIAAAKDTNKRDRMDARLLVYAVNKSVPELKAKAAALAAQDPAYKTVYGFADRATKKWNDLWQTDQAIMTYARRVHFGAAAKSNSATKGCIEEGRTLLDGAIKQAGADRFGKISGADRNNEFARIYQVIVADDRSAVMVDALSTCLAARSKEAKASPRGNPGEGAEPTGEMLLLSSLQWTSLPVFGPRHDTFRAMLVDGSGLEFEKSDTNLAGSINDLMSLKGGSSGSSPNNFAFSTVTKVKKTAKGLQVTFEKTKKTEKDQCLSWTDTKRVSRINADGSVDYHSNCNKRGNVTYNVGDADVVIDAAYAAGVNPGVTLFAGNGMAIAVVGKNGVPTHILGVEVK